MDIDQEQKLLNLVTDKSLDFSVRDAAWTAIRAQRGFLPSQADRVKPNRYVLAAQLLRVLIPRGTAGLPPVPWKIAHSRVCRRIGQENAGRKRVRTDWAMHTLVKTGLAHYPDKGVWQATEVGRELAHHHGEDFNELAKAVQIRFLKA